jgi:hypothetical protein
LHCGQVCLTLAQAAIAAKRCRLGMRCAPRGDPRSGSSPPPSTAAANSSVRDRSSSSRCGRVE